MRSKIAKTIYDETPEDLKIFVRKHSDIVVRIYHLLKEKGWTQKDLAAEMKKTPSEISKWLSGDHNFTLRSLAKLEAELGADIIYIPKKDSFHVQRGGNLKSVVPKAEPVPTRVQFQESKRPPVQPGEPLAA